MDLLPKLLNIDDSSVTIPALFRNGTQAFVSQFDPLSEQPYRGNMLGSTHIVFEDTFDLGKAAGAWTSGGPISCLTT